MGDMYLYKYYIIVLCAKQIHVTMDEVAHRDTVKNSGGLKAKWSVGLKCR